MYTYADVHLKMHYQNYPTLNCHLYEVSIYIFKTILYYIDQTTHYRLQG